MKLVWTGALSTGPVLCRQSPLHVLRVVLQTCDEVSDRFSLVADPIHSSEEGEPVGRQGKSPQMAQSEHLDFCHGMQEQVALCPIQQATPAQLVGAFPSCCS